MSDGPIFETLADVIVVAKAHARRNYNASRGLDYGRLLVCRDVDWLNRTEHTGQDDCPCGPIVWNPESRWLELPVSVILAQREILTGATIQ